MDLLVLMLEVEELRLIVQLVLSLEPSKLMQEFIQDHQPVQLSNSKLEGNKGSNLFKLRLQVLLGLQLDQL